MLKALFPFSRVNCQPEGEVCVALIIHVMFNTWWLVRERGKLCCLIIQTQVSPFDTDVIDTTHLWLIWVIFKEGDLEALKTLDTFGNCKR